ncbi:thioredoxin family protein [Hoyosella subflava]|uniref:Thioredoxin n=1 Tax=Hoyosella subflava (strain DSM 45089 / JCM 17490 / NBRC 109087 / DQS3-9A1) TaxID=443218 RepID=F6ELA6_HOYSD|nr:thioredoxin family protein [Hoyosella subflava]AEF39198.1 thioredoxin [Hoyosella subflava DQS3-9A1]
MSGLLILSSATAIATAVGIWWQRRNGAVLAAPASAEPADTAAGSATSELLEAGLSVDGPTVVHFTADWCGPCAAVRRVISTTLPEFPHVTHIELDIDDYPQLTRTLGVRSLPTTLVYDAEMQQRYRIPGVPTASALREALIPVSGHGS